MSLTALWFTWNIINQSINESEAHPRLQISGDVNYRFVLPSPSLPCPSFPSFSLPFFSLPPFCPPASTPSSSLFSLHHLQGRGPSSIQSRDWGSAVSSPSRFGWTKPTNGFWCILSWQSLSRHRAIDTNLHKFRERTPVLILLNPLLQSINQSINRKNPQTEQVTLSNIIYCFLKLFY